MALLKIQCSSCQHGYYRIVVACNREGVDMTCPACHASEGQVSVVRTKNGSTPFASCTHTSDKGDGAPSVQKDSSAPQTHGHDPKAPQAPDA